MSEGQRCGCPMLQPCDLQGGRRGPRWAGCWSTEGAAQSLLLSWTSTLPSPSSPSLHRSSPHTPRELPVGHPVLPPRKRVKIGSEQDNPDPWPLGTGVFRSRCPTSESPRRCAAVDTAVTIRSRQVGRGGLHSVSVAKDTQMTSCHGGSMPPGPSHQERCRFLSLTVHKAAASPPTSCPQRPESGGAVTPLWQLRPLHGPLRGERGPSPDQSFIFLQT